MTMTHFRSSLSSSFSSSSCLITGRGRGIIEPDQRHPHVLVGICSCVGRVHPSLSQTTANVLRLEWSPFVTDTWLLIPLEETYCSSESKPSTQGYCLITVLIYCQQFRPVCRFSLQPVETRCSYCLSSELLTDENFGVTTHGVACIVRFQRR